MIGFLYKIKGNSNIALYFFVLLIDNIYSIIASTIVNLIDSSLIEGFQADLSLIETFIITVLIGPLIETFIFQFLIIEVLWFFKIKTNYIVWISAILFSLSHNYNYIYIILILFPGLLYASFYLYLKLEKIKRPFLIIYSIHLISNFIAFIINDILNL